MKQNKYTANQVLSTKAAAEDAQREAEEGDKHRTRVWGRPLDTFLYHHHHHLLLLLLEPLVQRWATQRR
jgi:hypothetical protein